VLADRGSDKTLDDFTRHMGHDQVLRLSAG
jgi:hypothetical protein